MKRKPFVCSVLQQLVKRHSAKVAISNLNINKAKNTQRAEPGNTKGGSITVPLTSCLTGLVSAVSQLTIFVFICETD
jgi:hypothetical protein